MDSLIGHTPLLKTSNLNTKHCELFLKMENMNCGGSIKDRIAKAMLDKAEEDGDLKPGMTILEGTVGNTGLALTHEAVKRGYAIIIVAPDKISNEKLMHLKAAGAELIITSSKYKKSDPMHYQQIAKSMAEKDKNIYYVDQFNNPANPLVHEKTTAPEIWDQVGGDLDVIITGAGTGGHLTGIGRFFKKVAPHVKIILADPVGSYLSMAVTGNFEKTKPWLVEGVGHDYVPATCDLSFVDDVITVADTSAFAASRYLLKQEGVLAGSSTGVVLAAAIKYCRSQTKAKKVVSFVYDTGNKYLSKVYSDDWLEQNGYDVAAINREFNYGS
jgi:cystathionine beta-synthase